MKRRAQIALLGVVVVLAVASWAAAQGTLQVPSGTPQPAMRFGNFIEIGNDILMHIIATNDFRYNTTTNFDFPIRGFSPPEGRLARGCKPPAFSRFLFQSAVKSAESF
jgi:hypothetical protein